MHAVIYFHMGKPEFNCRYQPSGCLIGWKFAQNPSFEPQSAYSAAMNPAVHQCMRLAAPKAAEPHGYACHSTTYQNQYLLVTYSQLGISYFDPQVSGWKMLSVIITKVYSELFTVFPCCLWICTFPSKMTVVSARLFVQFAWALFCSTLWPTVTSRVWTCLQVVLPQHTCWSSLSLCWIGVTQ